MLAVLDREVLLVVDFQERASLGVVAEERGVVACGLAALDVQGQVHASQELVEQEGLRSVEGEASDDDSVLARLVGRGDVEGDVASDFLVAQSRGSGADELEDREDAELGICDLSMNLSTEAALE